MKKLSSINFSNFVFPALIILLTGLLAIRNYQPGTFLSGWDTLHPEFNLSLYLKRAFWGVWQEHQGVGAVASQAHAAELTRIPIVFILSLILPLSAVRYGFFILALAMGSLGTYFFARYLLSQHSFKFVNSASFVGAVFYVLNLATLQQYYVPLEMFAVHFATLPWLLFLATAYLREGKRKNLLWFALTTLLATSIAHTATLFYVYLVAFSLFVGTVILIKRKRETLKRGAVLILLTLALNLFWLAPNLYYIVNHAMDVEKARISQVFSDEAFLQSKAFGDTKSLVTLKNFLFNWREYSFEKGTFVDLMNEWNVHLAKPFVQTIAAKFFILSLFGIIVALFRKSKYALALFPVFLLSIFFWINSNPPFTAFFEYLRGNSSIFREGLRFPFTKFSIILVCLMSIFLAFTVRLLAAVFDRIKIGFLVIILSLAANIYFIWPAFAGNLISPSMKVKIPQEYFQVFEYFQKQNTSARVAKLPLQTFWGWNFYDWGYQGAGFTWFGIQQPTLDREFDRWSPYNESFYNQASFALYNKDLVAFEKVLQEYQVKYLLLDESIINAGGSERILFNKEIKKLLNTSKHIKQDVKFSFLTIYKTDFELGNQGISAPQTYTKVDADLIYSDRDGVFGKVGTYIYDPNGVAFPYANLDKRGPVAITLKEGKFEFTNSQNGLRLTFPAERIVTEELGKRGFAGGVNCDLMKLGSVGKEIVGTNILYTANLGGVSCDYLDWPKLNQKDGYFLRVKGENMEGRSLKIYLNNLETGKMDLEELLATSKFDELFVIYPKTTGVGYVLNLETRSYGRVASKNVLEAVELYKLPVDWITNLYFDTESNSKIDSNLKVAEVKKFGPSLYSVKVEGEGLLTLGQGYEEGWIAPSMINDKWSMTNIKMLKHVKVNSWENGWVIENSKTQKLQNSKIYIVFWPQYLEFAGVFISLSSLILALLFARGKRAS